MRPMQRTADTSAIGRSRPRVLIACRRGCRGAGPRAGGSDMHTCYAVFTGMGRKCLILIPLYSCSTRYTWTIVEAVCTLEQLALPPRLAAEGWHLGR